MLIIIIINKQDSKVKESFKKSNLLIIIDTFDEIR